MGPFTANASNTCASESTVGRNAGRGFDTAGPQARRLPCEEFLDSLQRLHQPVDLLLGVVEVEARAGRARQAELAHQGLVAVVAAAERDAVLIRKGDDVVRVHAFEREADQSAAF